MIPLNERVAACAIQLDKLNPGWAEWVNPRDVDTRSVELTVPALAFSGYAEAVKMLGVRTAADAIRLGLNAHRDDGPHAGLELQRCWLAELALRREGRGRRR